MSSRSLVSEGAALGALLTLAALAAVLVYGLPTGFSLDIGTPAAQPYMHGFAAPEANERYTYAFSTPNARLSLPAVGAGVHRLTIRMSGWRPDEAEPAVVGLALREREVGTFVVPPHPRIYHMLVPGTAPTMQLRWSGTMFRPDTSDTRQIGVAVDRVEIASLWTAPTSEQVFSLLLCTLLGSTLARRLLSNRVYAYGMAAVMLALLTSVLAVYPAWGSHLLLLCLGLAILHIVLWLPAIGPYLWRQVLPVPERLFVCIGSLSGVLYLLAAAPFAGFDEHHHFFRAYQVAQGEYISARNAAGTESGGMLPSSIDELVNQAFWQTLLDADDPTISVAEIVALGSQELAPHERQFIDFRGAALYSPVPYLAQSAGIVLGRAFDLAPIWLFYLARLTNLAVALGIIFYAIKIIPVFKWVVLLIGLAPTTMFQMATLSADSLTNSLALLFVALVLQYAFSSMPRLHWRDMLLLALVGAALALSKHMYFLLVLLYFLIPLGKIGNITRYVLGFLGIAAAVFVPLLGWTLIVQHAVLVPRFGPEAGVSPAQQVQGILADPPGYLLLWLRVLSYIRPIHITDLVGVLGSRVRLDAVLIGVHVLSIIALSLVDGRRYIIVRLWHKGLILSIIAASVFMIYTLGYIGWNRVGDLLIRGIQLRYFIPLILPCCLLCYNHILAVDVRRYYLHLVLAGYLIGLAFWSAWHVLTAYVGL